MSKETIQSLKEFIDIIELYVIELTARSDASKANMGLSTLEFQETVQKLRTKLTEEYRKLDK